MQNHLWCPNDPGGQGIDDDDDDVKQGSLFSICAWYSTYSPGTIYINSADFCVNTTGPIDHINTSMTKTKKRKRNNYENKTFNLSFPKVQ